MGNEALHTNMYIYLQRINTCSVKGRELFLINKVYCVLITVLTKSTSFCSVFINKKKV